MSRRTTPPPRTDVDDLAAVMRRRRDRPQVEETAENSPQEDASASSDTCAIDVREAAAGPVMVRRSWYLPADAADALATAVDDLHWTTRRPKHEILAALITTGLEHLDDIRIHLSTT